MDTQVVIDPGPLVLPGWGPYALLALAGLVWLATFLSLGHLYRLACDNETRAKRVDWTLTSLFTGLVAFLTSLTAVNVFDGRPGPVLGTDGLALAAGWLGVMAWRLYAGWRPSPCPPCPPCPQCP